MEKADTKNALHKIMNKRKKLNRHGIALLPCLGALRIYK